MNTIRPEPAFPGLISIILPTYRESENIQQVIAAIFQALPDPVEVIVVDDNSPDGTWRLAAETGDPRVRVIRRTKTRGLASAINRGLIESSGDLIGWMDADLSQPPSVLPCMLAELARCDVVIASRYAPGGQDARSPTRVWSSRLINRLASICLGSAILDYDSGCILMRRNVLDAVTLNPTGYGEYFIEFIYTCCRRGLKVVEIPYTLIERARGVSKSSPNPVQFGLIGLGYILKILKCRLMKLE